jgi:demethylmenaquinone methyltransferase / 2-methoxy-6-polyprenyl-1,4-benzoquinol methylase
VSDKRTLVRGMFSRIAPNYDLANRLLTFGMDQSWRKQAAQFTLSGEVREPYLLDIGTGTGDLAITLSTLCPNGHLVGIDLTTEMLELAVAKIGRDRTNPAPRLINGDSLDLPFPGDTFDGVTSAFVLRNLASLESAFAEMVRVAKPNARIVALEITQPGQPIWRTFYRLYFYRVVPLLGGLVSGDFPAYRYLPYSLSIFVSAGELTRIMTHAGIRNVQYILLNRGTVAIHFGIK